MVYGNVYLLDEDKAVFFESPWLPVAADVSAVWLPAKRITQEELREMKKEWASAREQESEAGGGTEQVSPVTSGNTESDQADQP